MPRNLSTQALWTLPHAHFPVLVTSKAPPWTSTLDCIPKVPFQVYAPVSTILYGGELAKDREMMQNAP